jgi:hypothetical protein
LPVLVVADTALVFSLAGLFLEAGLCAEFDFHWFGN